MFSRRSFVAAGLLAPLARPAAAEARYPAHSVTVVNPFAAGGQSYPIGRIVNAHFQNALGQPFLMENRTGAGGTIGGQYVVRSAPTDTLCYRYNEHVHDRTLRISAAALRSDHKPGAYRRSHRGAHGARCKREKRISNLQ